MTKIHSKICGIKSLEIAEELVNSGAEFIGFIFFEKSPRHINLNQYKNIASKITGSIKIVTVLVNPSDDQIQQIIDNHKPDFIQLHGKESPERVKEIKEKFDIAIIKALAVSNKKDIEQAEIYSDICEYILFDAKPPKGSDLPGGNNISFDWSILSEAKLGYKWFLSGGLNVENIEQAINSSNAKYIDISSGVEIEKGEKDLSKVNKFLSFVNHLD